MTRGQKLGVLLALISLLAGTLWLATQSLREFSSKPALESLGSELLGTPIRVGDVALGWFPPRVVLRDLKVGSAEEAVHLEAPRAELQPDLMSLPGALLGRRVSVSGLRVMGGRLELRAVPVAVPWRQLEAVELRADPAAGNFYRVAGSGKLVADPALTLSWKGRASRDGRLALTLGLLSDPESSLRVTALEDADAPYDVRGEWFLGAGGVIRVAGSVGRDATADLRFDLESVEIGALRPYLREVDNLEGRARGSVALRGPLEALDSIVADLVLVGAELATPGVELSGQLVVRAELAGALTAPEGRVYLDAKGARLRYHDFYRKEVGTPASLVGELYENSTGAIALANLELRVEDFRAELR